MEAACNCTVEPLPPAWVNQRTIKVHEMPAPYQATEPICGEHFVALVAMGVVCFVATVIAAAIVVMAS